jgi:hypothetical protein
MISHNAHQGDLGIVKLVCKRGLVLNLLDSDDWKSLVTHLSSGTFHTYSSTKF